MLRLKRGRSWMDSQSCRHGKLRNIYRCVSDKFCGLLYVTKTAPWLTRSETSRVLVPLIPSEQVLQQYSSCFNIPTELSRQAQFTCLLIWGLGDECRGSFIPSYRKNRSSHGFLEMEESACIFSSPTIIHTLNTCTLKRKLLSRWEINIRRQNLVSTHMVVNSMVLQYFGGIVVIGG
jgi:hypothetical protein